MADTVTYDHDIVDCSTVSITYQANGLAQISMTIFVERGQTPTFGSSGVLDMVLGGVRFKGFVSEINEVPASEVERDEYKITAIAIGCREDGNPGCV